MNIYEEVIQLIIQYEKAYAEMKNVVKECAQKYQVALLYHERFTAFDAFTCMALPEMIDKMIHTIDKLLAWKQYQLPARPLFIWNGQNFFLQVCCTHPPCTVRLLVGY
jgi:hypothetical protein